MEANPLQRTVVITNPNGLHMRPSASFVELAGKFQSDVQVIKGDGQVANGKSIFDLLFLAAECGTELTLRADGPDAPQALDALAELLAQVPVDA